MTKPTNYRTTDPLSSKLAGKAVIANGNAVTQREEVLKCVDRNPYCTSREIAFILGIDRYTPARRLPELEREGAVVRKSMRKCQIGGRLSVTWCTSAWTGK